MMTEELGWISQTSLKTWQANYVHSLTERRGLDIRTAGSQPFMGLGKKKEMITIDILLCRVCYLNAWCIPGQFMTFYEIKSHWVLNNLEFIYKKKSSLYFEIIV